MSYGVHAYVVDFNALPQGGGDLDGYGLEDIVGQRFLPNRWWSAMRMSWFDTVDAALKAASSDVSLSRFFMRGSPVEIIPADDFPMVGHIRPDEVAGLAESLRSAVTKIEGEEYDAIVEILGWLNGLADGEGVISFYY